MGAGWPSHWQGESSDIGQSQVSDQSVPLLQLPPPPGTEDYEYCKSCYRIPAEDLRRAVNRTH